MLERLLTEGDADPIESGRRRALGGSAGPELSGDPPGRKRESK
jgi:hypothetical protein